MGNTIRREPISFGIPAAPNYQFLNILNFNGLNMTDNPFTADSTTASDCLNVYVDEVNALTTRPRLEKILDKSIITNMTKCFGIYPISVGYLVHCMISGSTYAMYIIWQVNGGWSHWQVSGQIPRGEKLSVFEQNDKIYILDGTDYDEITYTFENGDVIAAEIKSVEGYIPTIRVGKSNTQEGSLFEDFNIVSSKFKETYFWDGTWDIKDNIGENIEDVENNYVKTQSFSTSNYTVMKYLPEMRDEYEDRSHFLAKSSNTLGFYYTQLFDDETSGSGFSSITMPSDLPQHYSDFTADASSDGSYIALLYLAENAGSISETSGGLYVRRNTEWHTVVLDTNNYFKRNFKRFSFVKISEDGNIIVAVSLNNLIFAKYNRETNSYDIITDSINDTILTNQRYQINGFKASADCSCVVLSLQSDSGHVLWVYKNLSSQTTILTREEIENSINIYGMDITSDGNGFIVPIGTELRHYYNFKTSNDYNIITSKKLFLQPNLYDSIRFHMSSDDDKIYYLVKEHTGWIMLNDKYTTVEVDGLYSGYGEMNQTEQQAYATATAFYYIQEPTTVCTKFNYSSTEPLLVITKNITNNNEWVEKREKFFKSLLTARFNNERWFASYNKLYYTSYNDPTYIGLYNYNDLGESDEHITGFNLAQDDLLIVYKDNRINTVRYGKVGDDTYTYIYSDSKNTVGNNAFGGSIVSILTETPLQISYDGIYVLKQLNNVQSDARISELISEGINKKWLTESKEVIKNCKTINRLYWTYFILSEKDYSKIYLLDNRTSSWFYWEIPIVVKNAFVKDNTTTFVDVDGNMYVLKTTDIINKFNNEITEYYDNDKKLIKWYWKSQILPMKTINYSKKLVSTTFVMSDTDEKDEYGLNYKFKAFRKTASQTQETTLTNNINYIVSTTKRTLIPRYNFMQIELSNIEGTDEDFDHNKLRLIGLAFKYVLLEGLI